MRIAQLTSPQAPVSPWADGHVERRAGLLAETANGNGQPAEPPAATTTDGDPSGDWASAYLAVAAHDVRSPLAAIQGYVETLTTHW